VQSVAVAIRLAWWQWQSSVLSCAYAYPRIYDKDRLPENREQRTALGLGTWFVSLLHCDCDLRLRLRYCRLSSFRNFCVIFVILVVRILSASKTSRT
jgi:hypothetical protein